jgi:hypothetical protein
LILVLDAVLSHDLDSAKGWRPADLHLRSLIDSQLSTTPGSSVLVSPSAFMGHRNLEISTVFGAYAIVVETHPTACLAFMGAPIPDLRLYKQDRAALSRVSDWLKRSWFCTSEALLKDHGEVDSLVCAMVAGAVGGQRYADLELFSPALLPGDVPRTSLAGAAPFYLLRHRKTYDELSAKRATLCSPGRV